jgi:hypothetical protein
MREKLNDNPVMQMVVIGVLIVLVGFFFMTRMKGSSSDTAAAPADPAATTATDPAAAAAAPATAAIDPATGAPAVDPATGLPATTGAVPAAAPPAGVATTSFTSGPGLPKSIVKAYDDNKAVALLITKHKGIDDKDLRHEISKIKGKNDVAVFTTEVFDVAKYSRIAQGVDLDRVPALVLIQPKKLAGKGNPPEASVSYGYRTPESIATAVQDAIYHGKVKDYSPR